MNYRITHTTTYDYTQPVSLCQNLAHVTPRDAPSQRCHASSLTLDPPPAYLASRADYFGNRATFFAVQEPHPRLTVHAVHQVELLSEVEPDEGLAPPWEAARTGQGVEAIQFTFGSRYIELGDDWAGYARPSFPPGRPLPEATRDLTHRIHRDFVYDPRATTVATPLREVFARRRGVCQDFAHLQIACLRSLGLAARYVSGYLCTVPAPGKERLIGADATHAWVSVWCPGRGWLDFDPTNDQVPSDRHILLAWGRDFDDVSPIKGVVLGGGAHTVRVAVEVRPADKGQ